MSVYREFNGNPCGRRVGDCAVRAISVALDVDWETAFTLLAANAFEMCDMPSSDAVINALLRQNGFYRAAIPNTCPDCYSVADFCREHPRGVYVLGFYDHVATIVDGKLIDSWDSRNEIPIYYWYRRR